MQLIGGKALLLDQRLIPQARGPMRSLLAQDVAAELSGDSACRTRRLGDGRATFFDPRKLEEFAIPVPRDVDAPRIDGQGAVLRRVGNEFAQNQRLTVNRVIASGDVGPGDREAA